MKKMSLQWRLTCITTLCIAIICGCLTMFVYKNGVYYMDSLQKAVDAQGDDSGGGSEEIYISIPEDKWDEFSNDFSVQVYNNKEDYKRNSLIVSALLALLGGVAAYFISGHALKPIREFSDKIEEVQAQNLADSGIEECKIKELNQLSVSYNKMLERLSDAFEIQRQFTASAAHELRTPLSLMQVQLDLYHSTQHPGSDADTVQMIKMLTEQNDRLGKMVKTLLDMSELQTVGRDEKIILNDLVDEVLEDLEPLAQEKNIKLIGKYKNITMIGSDILIYRLVYNLVENAIKYNHSDGQVTVNAYKKQKHIYLSVEDTGSRMFWFDRENSDVIFADNREIKTTLCDGRRLLIKPDIKMDFRDMPYKDNSFKVVVFDPPHLIHAGTGSWLAKKYGILPNDWKTYLKAGFDECMRVLEPDGVLVFKWNEDQIKLNEVLKEFGKKLLLGDQRGKTRWILFMK